MYVILFLSGIDSLSGKKKEPKREDMNPDERSQKRIISIYIGLVKTNPVKSFGKHLII